MVKGKEQKRRLSFSEFLLQILVLFLLSMLAMKFYSEFFKEHIITPLISSQKNCIHVTLVAHPKTNHTGQQ